MRFGQILQRLLHRGHGIIIVLRVGLLIKGAGNRHIQIGIIVQIKAAVGDIGDAADGAVANGGAASLHHGNIIAGGDHAHHGVFRAGEGLLVLLLGQDGEGAAHAHNAVVEGIFPLHHTFIFRLRPAAVHQQGAVHIGAAGAAEAAHAVEPGHKGVAGGKDDLPVGHVGGHDGLHPRNGGDGRRVALLQTKAADDAQVVEVGVVIILAGGVAHIRRCDQQTRQKAAAQRHDGKNGKKAAEAAAHRPDTGLPEGTVYHSICSTGTGPGLTSLLMIRPLFTRMTRSAMAVRAVLWVMTMTVLPVERQVSCSSFRMLLPVT